VSALTETTKLSQPLVSQHCGCSGVNLVTASRSGRVTLYSLTDDHVAHVIQDPIAHTARNASAGPGAHDMGIRKGESALTVSGLDGPGRRLSLAPLRDSPGTLWQPSWTVSHLTASSSKPVPTRTVLPTASQTPKPGKRSPGTLRPRASLRVRRRGGNGGIVESNSDIGFRYLYSTLGARCVN
jgi:hypothetical protein